MVGLKCLSARFVIDIKVPIPDNGKMAKCLKCLSARFVIDITILDTVEVEAPVSLKCLSARFVIDIINSREGMGR